MDRRELGFIAVIALFLIVAFVLIDVDTTTEESEPTTTVVQEPITKESTPVVVSNGGDTPLGPTFFPSLMVTVANELSLTEYPPNAPFEVLFNQPMNRESGEIPLAIDPPVIGTITWLNGGRALRFTPDEPFIAGQNYTISLVDGLVSQQGERLIEKLEWEVQIVSAPSVLGHTPDNVASQIERLPTFEITFDREMDRDAVALALQMNIDVPLHLSWQEFSLLITPREALEPGRFYQFTLLDTAIDIFGSPLSESYTWWYRMASLQERVEYPTLETDELLVTWYFNYPIDPNSVTFNAQPMLEGTLTWNEDYTSLSLGISNLEDVDTTYLISLGNNLRDTEGNPLPSLNGLPIDLASITPEWPQVPSYLTANEPLRIAFPEPVDQAQVEASFSIDPPVSGTIDWPEDTLLAFYPNPNELVAERLYAVTIAEISPDFVEGEIVLTPHTWEFIVTQEMGFGVGEATKIVNSNGASPIQWAVPISSLAASSPVQVQFELYAYDLENWLADKMTIPVSLVSSWTENMSQALDGTLQETMIPANVLPGVYLLRMNGLNIVQDELVVFVTDYGVIAQVDAEQVRVAVSDFVGRPAGNAPVVLYDMMGEQIDAGQTDSAGFVTFTRPGDEFQIVAFVNGQTTVTRVINEWQTRPDIPNLFDDDATIDDVRRWFIRYEPTPTIMGHLYTDRPAYRPGEIVNFRGIFHQWQGDSLQPLIGEPISITLVTEVGWETSFVIELFTNEFGTVNGSYTLPEAAQAGYYTFQTELEGQRFPAMFTVEPKPSQDIIVTVNPSRPVFPDGELAGFRVTVTDSAGMPMPDVGIWAEYYRAFDGVDCFSSDIIDMRDNWEPFYPPDYGRIGRTTADGEAGLSIPAYLSDPTRPGSHDNSTHYSQYAILVHARVGDEVFSSIATYQVASAFEEIVLDDLSQLQTTTQSFTIGGLVQDVADNPMPNRVLQVVLRHEGVDVYSTEVVSDPAGHFTQELATVEQGIYEMFVSGHDVFENEFSGSRTFYVNDPSLNFSDSTPAFTIASDYPTYEIGDTARFIIHSNFASAALFTLEQRTIQSIERIELTPPFTIVEVPITEQLGAQIFATVQAWQPTVETIHNDTETHFSFLSNHTLEFVSTAITVNDPTVQLNISVEIEDEPIAGSETTLTLRVTDYAGAPVTAEISLSMADGVLFDHYPYHSPNLASLFHTGWPTAVRTYHSMPILQTWGYVDCCACDGGAWGVAEEMSSVFRPEGVWFGALVTDTNGEVEVTLPAVPDVPAGRQITIQAVSQTSQFGQMTLTIP